ncbi:hypothetical protein [Flexibacterium corallicola]|uniref:hypothetical protein n=1 Tax=Flexibacterium corallicola TaxID=3037259 RepID=UPI00286F5EEA|nr:hypothetical protein [Pseudovibrio sp. M1P-2-3]
MLEVPGKTDTIKVYRHRDDARILASFHMQASKPLVGTSRADVIANLTRESEHSLQALQHSGRKVQYTITAQDPITLTWLETRELAKIGPAYVAKSTLRFTPQCTLVADYLSPSVFLLQSRWRELSNHIVNLGRTARHIVVPDLTLVQNTAPQGIMSLAINFGVPFMAGILFAFGIATFRPIESLSTLGRLLYIALPTAVCLYALKILDADVVSILEQLSIQQNVGFLALLIWTVLLAMISLLAGEKTTLLFLTTSMATGLTLVTANFLNWTPANVNFNMIGILLLVSGCTILFAWLSDFKITSKLKR